MDNVYLNEENDLLLSSYECPQFFAEEKMEEERNPLMELFPDTLAMSLNTLDHYSDPQLKLFGDLIIESDLGCSILPMPPCTPIPEIQIVDNDVLVIPKHEPKKRGRPRKNNEASPALAQTAESEPPRKYVPSVELTTLERKKKKRKCMTSMEKAQHNHLERERRKGMTLLLERLRELVPAVKDDKKASQKKIVDEAMVYLTEQKPDFLAYLKEKQKFLSLENSRRQLEKELASGRKGFLCVWEERKGMSTRDLHKKVKKEAREDVRDEEIDEAILVLESAPRSPESNPDYSDSSADSDEEEHIEVEV